MNRFEAVPGVGVRRDRDWHSRCDLATSIRRTLALCVLVALAASGCADDTTTLAEGRHALVRLVREGGDRAYLLSIRDPQPDGGVLQITPLDRPDARCDVGWIDGEISLSGPAESDHGDVVDIADGEVVQVVAWREDEGAPVGDLMHVDMQCNRREPSLANVVELLQMEGGAWLATTATQELWRLVPETAERRLLATNAIALEAGLRSGGARHASRAWTIEGGEVVEREATGEVLQRFGEGATELRAWMTTAYFTNQDGVHEKSVYDPDPVLIEPGGCRPTVRGGLVYSLAPCEERRLVARRPGTGEQWAFQTDVALPIMLAEVTGEPYAVFATGSERPDLAHLWAEGALGTWIRPPLEEVWLFRGADEQHLVGRDVRFMTAAGLTDDGIEFAVVQGPDPHRATLRLWSASEGARDVANGVAWLQGGWIVHQFDGSVGELGRLEHGWRSIEPSAAGVLPESIRLLGFPGGHFGYLRDADPNTGRGTLEVQALFSDGSSPKPVRENVRQFLGISTPQPGFVLAVGVGDGTEQVLFQRGYPSAGD